MLAEVVPINDLESTRQRSYITHDRIQDLTFRPDGTMKKPEGGATIANFYDYVPNALPSNPVNKSIETAPVRNAASAVADQLIQNTTNENIYMRGSGPYQGAFKERLVSSDGPPVIRSGPFLFQPYLNTESIYNDNFFYDIKPRRNSQLLNTNPGFDMDYQPNAQTKIKAYFGYEEHLYTTSVVPDYKDEHAGFSVQLNPLGLSALTLTFEDLFDNYGNTVQNNLASQFDIKNLQFRTGIAYATNSLPVSLRYKSDRLALEAQYTLDTITYRTEKENSTLQNKYDLRAAYSVVEDYLNVFSDYKCVDTSYTNANKDNFLFQEAGAGISGKFEHLTYRLKLDYNTNELLNTGKTDSEPGYSVDLSYIRSRRLDFSIFANRDLTPGVLTGGILGESQGALVNLRPLMRGQFTLTAVQQESQFTSSIDRLKSLALIYRHTFLGWVEPKVGVTYSRLNSSGTFAFITGGNPVGIVPRQETTWTGSGSVGLAPSPRVHASLNYYHEVISSDQVTDRLAGQTTDRLTAEYEYRINYFSKANAGYDYVQRENAQIPGKIKSNEFRIGMQLSW